MTFTVQCSKIKGNRPVYTPIKTYILTKSMRDVRSSVFTEKKDNKLNISCNIRSTLKKNKNKQIKKNENDTVNFEIIYLQYFISPRNDSTKKQAKKTKFSEYSNQCVHSF